MREYAGGLTIAVFLAAGGFVPYLWQEIRESAPAPQRYVEARGPEEPLNLLFVGDVMLDRSVRSWGEREGYDFIFENSSKEFDAYDAVIANLEGPVTDLPSVSQYTSIDDAANTQFTFAPQALEALVSSGVTHIHLGNNHILDFGRSGLWSTERYVRGTPAQFFGDINGRVNRPLYIDESGIRVALVSYNQFLGNGSEELLRTIEEAGRYADIVVVYTHWGEEYLYKQPKYIIDRAHAFIDAGADMVIGSHPHVVAEHEVYRGKHIYYSLGNFVFDQYWDRSVRCGMALSVTIDQDGEIAIREHTTSFKNGQVRWGLCE